jgi:hypothetical protein
VPEGRVQAQGPQKVFHRQVGHADVGDDEVGVPAFVRAIRAPPGRLFCSVRIGFAEGGFENSSGSQRLG